jgi:hypothetical protein
MSHGLCHCGCGELAPIAKRTQAQQGWVRGEPKRFIQGHFQAQHKKGHLSRTGVPIEEIRPDLIMLWRLHGTWKRVAEVLTVHPDVLYRWRKDSKHLSWATAQRIRTAVLGDLRDDRNRHAQGLTNTEYQRMRRAGIKDGTWVKRTDRGNA